MAAVNVNGSISLNGLTVQPIILPCTVANLPPAGIGQGFRGMATDSNSPLLGGLGNIVVGGGTDIVPLYSDGTAWRIG
jgi:hypothetical protein